LHSGHAYVAFERHLEAAARRISGEVRGVGVHRPETVSERVVQRIVELTLWPFVALFARDPEGVQGGDRAVICDGITLNPNSGRVTISFTRLLGGVGEFLAHWAHMTYAVIGGGFSGRPAGGPSATLLFGVGLESIVHDGSDARFLHFCRVGPIESLRSARSLIVQANQANLVSSDPEWAGYDRFPLHHYLRTRSVGFAARLALLTTQLRALVSFAQGILASPLIALLARDVAYSFVVTEMDKRGMIDAVLVTNASYASQPLWMRSPGQRAFPVYMVWYSQNVQPMVYRSDGLQSVLPNYRHLWADEHWVWTPGLKTYLEHLSIPGPIHVVGPILWYLPEAVATPGDGIRIVIFDITPVTDERAGQIGLICNYYSASHMIRFIEETVAACRAVEADTGMHIRLYLKHKRGYNPGHDSRYIELIRHLTEPGGEIRLLPSETNMFTLLRNAALAVVVPYSSPAYVADAVGTPAVFFDPTEELLPQFEQTPKVGFASGCVALRERIEKAVCQHGAGHQPR